MARSSWKFIPVTRSFIKLVLQTRSLRYINSLKKANPEQTTYYESKIKRIKKYLLRKINFRYLIISKSVLGLSVFVHKGSFFKKLFLSRFLLGRRFGEFAFTRKPFKYPIKKKKKNFIRR